MGMPCSWSFEGGSSSSSPENIHHLKQKRESLEEKADYIRKKKMEKLRAARYLNMNIHENQKKRELAVRNLIWEQSHLLLTKTRFQYLSDKLDRTFGEKTRLANDAGIRLKNLYTGERISILQMVLDSNDISTLLDRLYFKQKLVAQDKKLLNALKKKTEEIKVQQTEVSNQKTKIIQTIGTIESYKNQIADRIEADRILRDKYRNDAQYYARAEAQLLQESASIRQAILAMTRRSPSESRTATINSTGTFSMPIFGAITSGFGYRRHPIHHVSLMHTGLDISGPNHGPVRAADGGQILYSGWRGGYGKVVMINHGYRNGVNLVSLYGHLSGCAVGAGQVVQKGQVIGYEGSTGFSTGPHVHFEIRENGTPVNPYKHL
ncbi:MAG: M23 family metallopeptidase [Cyanobacteria bacterium]|nr:M23 family metallopeptidase [Cyanobacteriota bacterium]